MSKEITRETLLTVKEASELTNLTVPTFYTNKRKLDLKFNEKSDDGVWLIKVGDLIDAHMLTSDFLPTKSPRMSGRLVEPNDFWQEVINEKDALIEHLRSELAELNQEKTRIEILASEREKQLDMVNRLIATLGVNKDA
jgi:hypothetical protein